MRPKFSASTNFASAGKAVAQQLTIMLVAIVLLIVGPLQRVVRADNFELKIDDGPAQKGGTIKMTVKWRRDGVEKSVTVAVTSANGDNSTAIRNKLKEALKADATISKDFNLTKTGFVENGVILYEGITGTGQPGVQMIRGG